MVIKRIVAVVSGVFLAAVLALAISSGVINVSTESISQEKHIFFKIGEKYDAEEDFRAVVKDPNNYQIFIENFERYADENEEVGIYLSGNEIMAKYTGRYRLSVQLKYRGSASGRCDAYITYHITVLDDSYADYRHIKSMYDFAGYDENDKFILMNDIIIDGEECLSKYAFFQGNSFGGIIVNPYGHNILLKNTESLHGLFKKLSNSAILYQLKISGIDLIGTQVYGVTPNNEGAIIDCNFNGKLRATSEAIAVAKDGSIIGCKFYGELIAPKTIQFPQYSVNCKFIPIGGGKINA